MDYNEMRESIIEELKKEYVLVPIKEKKFSVKDIIDKYQETICKKCDIPYTYSNIQGVANAIRKIVCMKFSVANIDNIPVDKRALFRDELERFIKEYLL